MKRLSDDEWVARARSRFATKGTWDTEPWNVADAKPDPPKSTGPTCPYCTKRPRLEEFRRYQSATSRPLLVCEACYGFWAVDDSLSGGFADFGDVPQGVFSHVGMRRC